MGAGASSVARLRKMLVIKAYNSRKATETVDDQFRIFAFRDQSKQLCISVHDIKKCLSMESKEYFWVDDLLQAAVGGNLESLRYKDFIKFLEKGITPNFGKNGSQIQENNNDRNYDRAFSPTSNSDPMRIGNKRKPDKYPPVPPVTGSSPKRDIVKDYDIFNHPKSQNNMKSNPESDTDELEESVMNINLSKVDSLPANVKLKSKDGFDMKSESKNSFKEEELTVIIHPKNKSSALEDTGGKPLWRKREIVRQERTVHYTTVDADGVLQELVEKETTQNEVLHMECRETGEFAHRETTQYEQQEMFNDEVVAQQIGNEEYVHLKSLEDEYHFMESNMPKKEPTEEEMAAAAAAAEAEQQQQQELEQDQSPDGVWIDTGGETPCAEPTEAFFGTCDSDKAQGQPTPRFVFSADDIDPADYANHYADFVRSNSKMAQEGVNSSYNDEQWVPHISPMAGVPPKDLFGEKINLADYVDPSIGQEDSFLPQPGEFEPPAHSKRYQNKSGSLNISDAVAEANETKHEVGDSREQEYGTMNDID